MITKIVGRTPRECVDWNTSLLMTTESRRSRTPRECVDWNRLYLAVKLVFVVALLVSAWIETRWWQVGVRTACVALLVSAWIETLKSYEAYIERRSRTPRECVDWNYRYVIEHQERAVALLVSAWIETPACCEGHRKRIVALLVSAWIEMIKRTYEIIKMLMSQPVCLQLYNSNKWVFGLF